MPDPLVLDGGPLTPEDVEAVAHRRAAVRLADELGARMEPARQVVESAVADGATVYGVTTGFGALASTRIAPEDAAAVQVSLLRSHAAGVGPPLAPELVRAILLLRARTLQGIEFPSLTI